jgi:Uma2 family endonuclease
MAEPGSAMTQNGAPVASFIAGRRLTPVLIIEILSPSNWPETWTNVWAYTTIPSVREILIVHSTKIGVELLRRDAAGHWPEHPNLYRRRDD